MVNRLNEKRGGMAIVAAIISALLFALAGLATGLALGIRNRKYVQNESSVARFLLVDAADGLNHTLSAMRLCYEPEPAAELSKTALVYAVRAETALECDNGAWDENRQKEAFLNDVATVLHTHDPLDAVKKASILFKYSDMFYKHVADGAEFEYNGEIMGGAPAEERPTEQPSEEQLAAAKKLLKDALGAEGTEFIGGYSGRLEFATSRGGKQGYAVTEGKRIVEFSFEHSGGEGSIDPRRAEELALDCARKCGYNELKPFNTDVKNNFAIVSLCKETDGAMACDDCASVAVVGDEAVAFTAGHCSCEHCVPEVKVDEVGARRAAPKAKAPGRLVVRTVDGRERVCYEYRYELEDGVHFVYVCAESGKQMQVK